jgi:hypothetical protein
VDAVALAVVCGGTVAAQTEPVALNKTGDAHIATTVTLPKSCTSPTILVRERYEGKIAGWLANVQVLGSVAASSAIRDARVSEENPRSRRKVQMRSHTNLLSAVTLSATMFLGAVAIATPAFAADRDVSKCPVNKTWEDATTKATRRRSLSFTRPTPSRSRRRGLVSERLTLDIFCTKIRCD